MKWTKDNFNEESIPVEGDTVVIEGYVFKVAMIDRNLFLACTFGGIALQEKALNSFAGLAFDYKPVQEMGSPETKVGDYEALRMYIRAIYQHNVKHAFELKGKSFMEQYYGLPSKEFTFREAYKQATEGMWKNAAVSWDVNKERLLAVHPEMREPPMHVQVPADPKYICVDVGHGESQTSVEEVRVKREVYLPDFKSGIKEEKYIQVVGRRRRR